MALERGLVRLLDIWAGFVARRAAVVVVLCLGLAVLGAVYVANNLVIDIDTEDMISAEVPFRRNNIAFKSAFPQFSNLVIAVIDGPTPEQADDAARQLADRLAANTQVFANVRAPGVLPFFRQNGLLYLEIEELEDVADGIIAAEPLLASLAADPTLRGLANMLVRTLNEPAAQDAPQLASFLDALAAQARRVSMGEPSALSWRSLMAGDFGTAALSKQSLVLAQPQLAFGSLNPGAEALDAVRTAASDLGIDESSGFRLRLTGDVAVDQEELASVSIGGRTAALVSLVLVTVLLLFGLRSPWLVIATVLTLLAGLVWTAAFATVSIGSLNLISVAFAVLFIGLGVDFGIHLSLRYREARSRGADSAAAVRGAVHAVGGSLGLSAIAAAAGFFSFLPTDYRGLAELGLIAGVGMFIAFFASLALLPALLAVLPDRVRQRPSTEQPKPLFKGYRAILIVAMGLGLVSIVAVPFARFDFNPLNLKDQTSESVATYLALAESPGTTPYAINVLVEEGDALPDLRERLERLPEVASTLAIADFVPADQEDKLFIIEDLAFLLLPVFTARKTPADATENERSVALRTLATTLDGVAAGESLIAGPSEELSTALGSLGTASMAADFEHRVFANFPALLDLLSDQLKAGPVDVETLPDALRRDWASEVGQLRLQVRPHGGVTSNDDLREFAQAVVAVAPNAAGVPLTVTAAADAILASFKEATLIAFVLITVILVVVLRRLADVLLVLVPLLLAALMTLAAAVVLGLAFNFANVIALPLLLGLGVASAIHLVLRRRIEGRGAAMMMTSTPRAVLFSSLTTVAAFGSLMLSGHRGMVSMGQLLAIAITFTLLSTLVVLPCLMAWLDARSR